jgi:hypothetical protein
MAESKELTDKEVERIDFIQNETFEYLKRLLPEDKAAKLEWDVDMLTYIIESAEEVLEERGLCTPEEFYPYRDGDEYEEEDDED